MTTPRDPGQKCGATSGGGDPARGYRKVQKRPGPATRCSRRSAGTPITCRRKTSRRGRASSRSPTKSRPGRPLDQSDGEGLFRVLFFDARLPEPEAVGQPVPIPMPRQQFEKEVRVMFVEGPQAFRHNLDRLMVRSRCRRSDIGSTRCDRSGWRMRNGGDRTERPHSSNSPISWRSRRSTRAFAWRTASAVMFNSAASAAGLRPSMVVNQNADQVCSSKPARTCSKARR